MKLNVIDKLKFVLGRGEDIVGKRENAGSPFPAMFSKGFFFKVDKSGLCGKALNLSK